MKSAAKMRREHLLVSNERFGIILIAANSNGMLKVSVLTLCEANFSPPPPQSEQNEASGFALPIEDSKNQSAKSFDF